jgi:hypothetical protein
MPLFDSQKPQDERKGGGTWFRTFTTEYSRRVEVAQRKV